MPLTASLFIPPITERETGPFQFPEILASSDKLLQIGHSWFALHTIEEYSSGWPAHLKMVGPADILATIAQPGYQATQGADGDVLIFSLTHETFQGEYYGAFPTKLFVHVTGKDGRTQCGTVRALVWSVPLNQSSPTSLPVLLERGKWVRCGLHSRCHPAAFRGCCARCHNNMINCLQHWKAHRLRKLQWFIKGTNLPTALITVFLGMLY